MKSLCFCFVVSEMSRNTAQSHRKGIKSKTRLKDICVKRKCAYFHFLEFSHFGQNYKKNALQSKAVYNSKACMVKGNFSLQELRQFPKNFESIIPWTEKYIFNTIKAQNIQI